MASNAVVAGPTSKRVADNVAKWRKARQLQQRDLSDKLTEVGRPMLPTVISKIERGERRIDVDDLIALSLALDVSPLALLLPTASAPDLVVELTEGTAATGRITWNWADGLRPIGLSQEDPVAHLHRFQADSRPPYARPALLSGVVSDDFTEAQKAAFAAAGYVESD